MNDDIKYAHRAPTTLHVTRPTVKFRNKFYFWTQSMFVSFGCVQEIDLDETISLYFVFAFPSAFKLNNWLCQQINAIICTHSVHFIIIAVCGAHKSIVLNWWEAFISKYWFVNRFTPNDKCEQMQTKNSDRNHAEADDSWQMPRQSTVFIWTIYKINSQQ